VLQLVHGEEKYIWHGLGVAGNVGGVEREWDNSTHREVAGYVIARGRSGSSWHGIWPLDPPASFATVHQARLHQQSYTVQS